MALKTLIFHLFFLLPFSIKAEWSFDQFFTEWGSPLTEKKVAPFLFTGASLTSLFIGLRNEVVEPFQKEISENKPLGDYLAKFGYTMGNMVQIFFEKLSWPRSANARAVPGFRTIFWRD